MTHDIDTLIRLSQHKSHIVAVRRLQLAFELELRDAKSTHVTSLMRWLP